MKPYPAMDVPNPIHTANQPHIQPALVGFRLGSSDILLALNDDVASVTTDRRRTSDTGIRGHREARRDFHPVHEAGRVVIVRLAVRDLVG